MNSITIEEVKNSIEYKWRIYYRNLMLISYLIVCLLSILFINIYLIGKYKNALNNIDLILTLVLIAVYTICFLPVILFYSKKAKYLLNNYMRFKAYEVILDTPSVSYIYRRAIYYIVTISDETISKTVNTNPYFSGFLFPKYDIKDYNNKKVIGLYDYDKEKFYIIKKI